MNRVRFLNEVYNVFLLNPNQSFFPSNILPHVPKGPAKDQLGLISTHLKLLKDLNLLRLTPNGYQLNSKE